MVLIYILSILSLSSLFIESIMASWAIVEITQSSSGWGWDWWSDSWFDSGWSSSGSSWWGGGWGWWWSW